MRRKKERSKQDQTNKAKQHSTSKAVTCTYKSLCVSGWMMSGLMMGAGSIL